MRQLSGIGATSYCLQTPILWVHYPVKLLRLSRNRLMRECHILMHRLVGGFYVGSKCRCASGLLPCSTRFKTSSCRLKSVSEVGRGSNLPQTVATCSSEGFVVSPYTFFKCQRRFPHASNMLRETQFREIHFCLPGRAFKAGGSIFRQSRVECTLSQILKRCGLWTLRGRNNHH
jgi:hypothetical protein